MSAPRASHLRFAIAASGFAPHRRRWVALFALAAASLSWAQPGKADRAARLRKLLFERFDKDGDHQLNGREQEAVRAKLRSLGVGPRSPKSSEGAGIDLRRFASTGDGALDEDEVKAAQSTAEGNGLHLTDSQLKRLEQAADVYDHLSDAKETGRSAVGCRAVRAAAPRVLHS